MKRRDFLGLAASLAASPALAQTEPSRTLRLIVPFAAGTSSDVMARLIAPVLGEHLNQTVVVDNRAGAGTNVGTLAAFRAPPDGNTLLLAVASNTINATLHPMAEFDFVRDFAAVARMISVANVVVTPMGFPAKTAKEFIDHTRAHPREVNMASNGNGSSTHVAGELFKAMAGADLVHVPYAGNYYPDLIANHVQVAFTPLSGVTGFIQSGQLRALAVTTEERSQFLPDVPALAEYLPGYQAAGWYGLVAPKGTPAATVERINRAANAAVNDKRLLERLPSLGAAPFLAPSSAAFGDYIAAETDKWAKVIATAKIETD
jgi:tripartite-type tricarboxylate transporter receptor subunit TctC